jgi:two-component system, cell cycle sensor histidine kinase and response regulator CckA
MTNATAQLWTMNLYEKQTVSGEETRSGTTGATAANAGGLCGSARDCGSREKTAAGVRFSEAQLRSLYENTPTGILLTEPEGRILAANPAACRILGRTEEQLRPLTRLDLAKPGDPRIRTLLAERERTGRYQGEVTLVRGDGSTFDAEVTSVVATDENDAITSVVIRDVTDRKRTEARLKEQAQWLDIANEAIIVIDLDHCVTYWNQGAERMGGWNTADVVGRSLANLLTSAGISDPQVLAVASQMTDWRGTISCRQRNGTPQVLATSITTLRDAHSQPTGRLCICTDITEQTKLKEKYERAQRLQSLGMLAASVAHDFNNILTPIQMSVPMLQERLSHRDDLALLETIQACVVQGALVTRQVLGFAQGTGSEARAIQVEPILREVAGIVRESFPRSITLETDTPSDLRSVMANPTQIHQVLLNLCVNARDAMPQGGRLRLGARNCVLDEEAAARIEGARKGAWLVLFVEDTGTGIAPELLPHIWEPFFTTKSSDKGTGLGLSTVRRIVETHAGFISIDTAAGRGTAFRVFLPPIGSGTLKQEPDAPRKTPGGDGKKILVVDDEIAIREVTKAALTKAGYHVATAANGAAALETSKARPDQFDLVLTDIDMPELDGENLALALAAIRPTLPVLAMSGLSSESTRVDPTKFSGGFLPKPFTVLQLLLAVRRALEHAAVGVLTGHNRIEPFAPVYSNSAAPCR